MKIKVNKSELKGRVSIPSSKSQTIRGLMCAALARGESEIVTPLLCEDTEAAANVLGQVGIRIRRDEGAWRVTGGTFHAPEGELHCGESATTLRFMTAICSIVPGRSILVGGPSLSKRPVKSLVEAMKKLRVKCFLEAKKTPPVTVEGGVLRGGKTELPGNISSQFISALLLVAPYAEKGVSIRLTTPMTSKPYILMTLRCLRKFGIKVRREFDSFVIPRQKYQTAKFEVEGDWSTASYFLAMGTFSEEVEVENLSTSSLQGDRVILDLLRGMGARISITGKTVKVGRADLKAISADLSDCIDLLPTVAVLAALAEGTSIFTGIERARIKESNRVAAVREGLIKLGVVVTEDRDRLTIVGMKKPEKEDEDSGKIVEEDEAEEKPPEDTGPKEVVIDSRNDHRIAMAFAVLGAAIGGVTIEGAECVAKTYPGFWDTFESLGGQLEKNGE